MGFFSALSKIIQGKPVFEPNQNQSRQQPGPSMPGQTPVNSGPKVYPQLYVGRVECRMSGDDMDVEITIKNMSQQRVDLDQMRLLGTSRDLGTFLEPGDEREFTVFSGDRPKYTNNNRMEINFKTDPGGDYFQADFAVDFKQEADGTYSIQRLRPLQVRDI